MVKTTNQLIIIDQYESLFLLPASPAPADVSLSFLGHPQVRDARLAGRRYVQTSRPAQRSGGGAEAENDGKSL